MLMCSGAVVSGSVALQFLDRVSYPSANLGIYVSHVNVEVAELWLLNHGMTKVPLNEGPDAMASDYASPLEILSVGDFHVPDSVRVIQLICTRWSPISTILGFHSCRPSPSFSTATDLKACVMNFISHDTAYALYPFSSRRGLRGMSHRPLHSTGLLRA
jgi:hypothetical protein